MLTLHASCPSFGMNHPKIFKKLPTPSSKMLKEQLISWKGPNIKLLNSFYPRPQGFPGSCPYGFFTSQFQQRETFIQNAPISRDIFRKPLRQSHMISSPLQPKRAPKKMTPETFKRFQDRKTHRCSLPSFFNFCC